jgi:DNA-binding transcriptional LysR family regulator
MELRHLRYFVAVADSRSLRLAAERIHVTQPAITRQIHDLEAELGVELFVRTPWGVTLTPAGELFLSETRTVFEVLDAAMRSARRVASGIQGRLRIGFVEHAGWTGVVPEVFQRFRQEVPDVGLELLPLGTREQLAALEDDRLDGGFVHVFDELPGEIAAIPIQECGVVLAIPERWALPTTLPVPARKLNGKPFICFPRHTNPAYHDLLIGKCREAGLTLEIVQEVSSEAAILSLVSAGVGAAIVNAANRERPLALTRFIDFLDLNVPLLLAFAYKASNSNAALPRFRQLLVPISGSS